ncbi:hypothetical protein CDIK_3356 [Cucumispora dikerogammari]|nr:hypothetical protein CDIK_3356 [Cucumispora dikerogammari]
MIVAYLLTGAYSIGMNAKLKYNFKKKAENFSKKNKQLYFTIAVTKYKHICDFDNDFVKAVCDRFHLPSHMSRNALREAVNKKYIGFSTNSIYNYARACFLCQRVSVSSPTLPLTPIIHNFIRERFIVDTIDVSEYAKSNMNKKIYIYNDRHLFKIRLVLSSEKKEFICFLRSNKRPVLYIRFVANLSFK